MNTSDAKAKEIVCLALDGKVNEANRAYAEAIAEASHGTTRRRGIIYSALALVGIVSLGAYLF